MTNDVTSNSVWFGDAPDRVVIVASAADDDLPDSKLTARNYSLFDRLGDRDSVFALGTLIARIYPQTGMRVMSAEDQNVIPLNENLLIVGGPGEYEATEKKWVYGNGLGRVFQERMPSRFSYSDDCTTLRALGKEFVAEFATDGLMTKDFGVFRRFANPFDLSRSIVMVHGIHTLGVVGACKVFDPNTPEGIENLRRATAYLGEGALNFECFFHVDVVLGNVTVPILQDNLVFPLPVESVTSARSTISSATLIEDDSTLAPGRLQQQVVAMISIARDQAIAVRKADLSALLLGVQEASLEVQQLHRMLEICRSSPLLPPQRIAELMEVIRA